MFMEATARAIGARAGDVAVDVNCAGPGASEARGHSIIVDGAALPRMKCSCAPDRSFNVAPVHFRMNSCGSMRLSCAVVPRACAFGVPRYEQAQDRRRRYGLRSLRRRLPDREPARAVQGPDPADVPEPAPARADARAQVQPDTSPAPRMVCAPARRTRLPLRLYAMLRRAGTANTPGAGQSLAAPRATQGATGLNRLGEVTFAVRRPGFKQAARETAQDSRSRAKLNLGIKPSRAPTLGRACATPLRPWPIGYVRRLPSRAAPEPVHLQRRQPLHVTKGQAPRHQRLGELPRQVAKLTGTQALAAHIPSWTQVWLSSPAVPFDMPASVACHAPGTMAHGRNRGKGRQAGRGAGAALTPRAPAPQNHGSRK